MALDYAGGCDVWSSRNSRMRSTIPGPLVGPVPKCGPSRGQSTYNHVQQHPTLQIASRVALPPHHPSGPFDDLTRAPGHPASPENTHAQPRHGPPRTARTTRDLPRYDADAEPRPCRLDALRRPGPQHLCSSDAPARPDDDGRRQLRAESLVRARADGDALSRYGARRAAADADGDPPFGQRAGDHGCGDADGDRRRRCAGAVQGVPKFNGTGSTRACGTTRRARCCTRRSCTLPRCTCSMRASSSIMGRASRDAFGSASASTR
jgi:hypothetical protein